MRHSLVKALSVAGAVVGKVDFGHEVFGHNGRYWFAEGVGTLYRIAVALDGNGGAMAGAEGDCPNAYVYNDFGLMIGSKPGHDSIEHGQVKVIHVKHKSQSVYTVFRARNEAICISYVTSMAHSKITGNRYAVTGDFGKLCGADWYPSHVYPYEESNYSPACFWIDADGSHPHTGFQVHWPSFAMEGYKGPDAAEKFCNGVDFGLRTEKNPKGVRLIKEAPEVDMTSKKPDRHEIEARKQKKKRRPWMKEQLVISDLECHSAKELCESASSLGPDFVHMGEQTMCEMETKTLHKLCSEEARDDCFELSTQTFLAKGEKSDITTRGDSPYKNIRDWRREQTTHFLSARDWRGNQTADAGAFVVNPLL